MRSKPDHAAFLAGTTGFLNSEWGRERGEGGGGGGGGGALAQKEAHRHISFTYKMRRLNMTP